MNAPENEYKALLKERAKEVEAFLETCFAGREIPERLAASMRYSLEAGGKRLRPVLCLSCAALGHSALVRGGTGKASAATSSDAAGCSGVDVGARSIEDIVLPFAAAIEMIHTYSLIHDDLPAMDNDDLRRGKPSNHKAFDEATAILAGDGLLSDAFLLAADIALPSGRVVRAVKELALAVGSSGMVGGQALDMLYTGGDAQAGLDGLKRMHAMKTGALLRASCLCGAILAGLEEEKLANVASYGSYLGLAFQITDDILDVVGDEKTLGKPVGSDEAAGKLTYPALVGLEKSRELAREASRAAEDALSAFSVPEADFLKYLPRRLLERVS